MIFGVFFDKISLILHCVISIFSLDQSQIMVTVCHVLNGVFLWFLNTKILISYRSTCCKKRLQNIFSNLFVFIFAIKAVSSTPKCPGSFCLWQCTYSLMFNRNQNYQLDPLFQNKTWKTKGWESWRERRDLWKWKRRGTNLPERWATIKYWQKGTTRNSQSRWRKWWGKWASIWEKR